MEVKRYDLNPHDGEQGMEESPDGEFVRFDDYLKRSCQFNRLTAAQHERLAILSEELGEAQKAIGKILRHGYESHNPTLPSDQQVTNRYELERELGDVICAIVMMGGKMDIDRAAVWAFAEQKERKIKPWLHHQEVS